VKFNAKLGDVREIDLLEDPIGGVRAVDDAILFRLKPYEVKTFRLVLQPSLPN
jgi:hypothetical protein